MVAGFASTIFQPTIAALQDARGWRSALTICAIGLGVITITIHALVLPGRPHHPAAHAVTATDGRPIAATAASTVRDPAMLGLTIAFTLSIGAMSAAIVHLIPYLTDHGWTDLHAAIAAGLIGATQVAARVVFGLFAERVAAARLALLVLLVPVVGIVVLATSNGAATAWLAVALLGIGQGTTTLLRPLVLSRRLDPLVYGRGAAQSAAWSTVARAVAPLAARRRRRPRRRGLPDRLRRLRCRSASPAPSSPTTASSSRPRFSSRRTPTPADDRTPRSKGGAVPRMKPDDLAEFLRQPHIGVLATLRRDGRPYTVPVWFLHHDDAFWITGTYDRVWCKQLFADPRASLCVEATAPVAGHVGIDGTDHRPRTPRLRHLARVQAARRQVHRARASRRLLRQHAHRAPPPVRAAS